MESNGEKSFYCSLCPASKRLCHELLVTGAKKPCCISAKFSPSRMPPRSYELCYLLRQDCGNDGTRMRPFVDQLIQYTGIAMLSSECGPKHLDSHLRNLANNTGIVAEPPTAVNVEIAEFRSQDAGFMLIIPGQKRRQESNLWKSNTKSAEHAGIGKCHDAVAGSL